MFGSLSSIKILRVTVSFALAFWIAGFGCIFGCESLAMATAEMTVGAPAPSVSSVVSGASCHKAVEHSCCAKRRPSVNKMPAKAGLPELMLASAPIIEIAGGMMRECPMALNAKALGTKPRTDESATMIAFEPIDLPLFNEVQTIAPPTPSFQNNRGHTYLHCCVFLI